jgi:CYTH domain-containing protein
MAWEIERRFLGTLDGLALIEIELNDESDPLPDPPQGVRILREVTDDNRFVSSCLAHVTLRKQRKFVKKTYKEVKGWTGLSD